MLAPAKAVRLHADRPATAFALALALAVAALAGPVVALSDASGTTAKHRSAARHATKTKAKHHRAKRKAKHRRATRRHTTQHTAAGTLTTTFKAVADANTAASAPTTNYGTRTSLKTDQSPAKTMYVRFNPATITSVVRSAKLQVYATASSRAGIEVHPVSNSSWDERTITWNTQPAPAGDVLGNSGAFGSRVWVSIDVTGAVQSGVPVTFAIQTASATATSFASREAGTTTSPALVVTQDTTSTPPPSTVDTTPPSTPGGLAATGFDGQASISWKPSTDDVGVAGYEVRRDGAALTTVAGSPFADGGLTNGTTYSYSIVAIDAAGNRSAPSAPVSVTPAAPDTTPPSAPSGLSAIAGDRQVALSWNAASDDTAVTGYRVYRGTTLVGSPAGTSFTDTGLSNGVTYTYTVKAADAAGNLSPASPSASALTVGPACPDFGGYTSLTPPDACWVAYNSTSPFNRPVPASPRYYADAARNTDSAKIVARLVSWGSAQSLIAGQTGAEDWWHPMYYSQATDPAYTIHCTQWTSACELEGKVVRIPAGAKPAGGGDGHLAVVDQATGAEYDMWQASIPSGSGGTLNVSHGGITQVDGDGMGSNATAAHFGLAAGIVRGAEMQAGAIAHALFSQIKCTGGYAVYPAAAGTTASSCSTFGLANQDAPPLGARLWLDLTSAQIDALAVPAWKKTLLKAMHDYGILIGDTNGGHAAWGIQAESEQAYASFGRSSYWRTLGASSGVGSYAGGYVFDIQSGVDWAAHLHVLDPCISQGTC